MRSSVKMLMACLALGVGPSLAAQGNSGEMLRTLERGQWVVTPRDGGPARSVCLGNLSRLVQLRHARSLCRRVVTEDAADTVTVQYTCRGNGYGRTSIRKETAGLVQIESQGVEGGRPFQFTAEARRTGACRSSRR